MTWLEEMRADHAQQMAKIESMESRLIQRMDERFAKVDERFVRLEGKVEVTVADAKADLMKWMLVFWVGAVGAIAALAGVLRQ